MTAVKNFIRASAALLCLVLLLALCACGEKKDSTAAATTAPTLVDASGSGVELCGFYSPTQLPRDEGLSAWYRSASARAQLTNAVYYGYDASEDRWYCWILVGECLLEEGAAEEALTLRVRESDGTLLLLCNAPALEEAESNGLYCISVPGSAEPSLELHRNGEYEGLILTRSKTAVKPS